jgi:drug/metabolite transporter (DMT)-like permease
MQFEIGPGEFYSLACSLAWAVAVILFKKSGESLTPFALNLFKNLLGLVLMFATVAALSPRWPALPGGALALILLSGLLGIGLGDTLYFRALNTIGAGRMAVAQTFYSPSVILLSAIFLAERLRLGQLVGVAVVLAGIVLATYQPIGNHLDARRLRIGAFYGLASVFVMAAGVVLAKPMLEQYDFLWVVTLRIVGGTVGMLAVMGWQGSTRSLIAELGGVRHWPQIVLGSVLGTYISMMLWLAGYKYTKASIAAVLNELAAIFIIGLAVLVLRERVTRRQLAGCTLAVAGVVLVVMR